MKERLEVAQRQLREEKELRGGKGEEVGDDPKPVKTIPSHFSKVVEAGAENAKNTVGSYTAESGQSIAHYSKY